MTPALFRRTGRFSDQFPLPILILICCAAPAAAKTLSALQVFPGEVHLQTRDDAQSFIVLATYEDGTSADVTAQAKTALSKPDFAKLHGARLTPVADGQVDLHVAFGGKEVRAPVYVKDAAKDRPISFSLDVMPVFMRAGCNSGSCHGSARGQDGFHLSLFGYDPDGDFERITREMPGRRVNLAVPDRSLLMEKSLGAVPHSGGQRIKPDSPYYHKLHEWLAAGAPPDEKNVAEPTGIQLFPPQLVLEGKDATAQLTVRATYSDGTDRDVTDLVVFLSNNDTSAKVDENGLITAAQRGEAFVMARFDTFTEGIQVIVIPEGLDYQRPELPANNYIDQLVYEKLHKLRIYPSDLCTDRVFIRRAYIDIVGLVPEPEAVEAFVADESPDKREKLVDELIGRKEFAELWVMKWAELLQMRTNENMKVSYKAVLLYFNWLEQRIAANVPFNEIVRDLLSASGGTFTNPATNFYQVERESLKVAENVAQVFMGMRIQCAQCHNHPFDRWTMDDYYSFAAFFAQIGRKDAEDPREVIVYDRSRGNVTHPVTKKAMQPKFLGGARPDVDNADRRAVLANWLASPDNPYFARNLANIVWSHFFGIGIIEPVDDVRVSNPASNPQLLDALAERFTEYDYDFKRLVRDICTSRVYQLSTQTNETNARDDTNFSHARVRRMRAEVLLDVISQVTETKNKFPGLPLGARAVQLADGNTSNYFLTTFGRAKRETVCSCEVTMEPNLSQALHLLNGDVTQKRIGEGNVVPNLLAADRTPQQVVENLYLRCLSRKPTDAEAAALAQSLEQGDPRQTLEDIFWALLNSKEFIFNH